MILPKVEAREHTSGTTYRVRFRLDGEYRSETFRRETDAGKFAKVVDALGGRAALDWLDRQRTATGPVTDHTVDTWVRHYIEHRSRISDGTRAEYLRLWARTFAPLFGDLPLDALTEDAVSAGIITLSRPNAHRKDGLSAKSLANARGLLAAASKKAVKDGHLPANPTEGVGIPRVKVEDDEHRYLTHDEWARVEAELPEHWRPMLLTMVGTGMRLGEVRALQVRDVDLEQQTLRVVRAFKAEPGGWVEGPPKSRRSRRTITLPAEVVAALRPLVDGKPGDALVFTTPTGNVVYPGNLRDRVWRPACQRAGITPIPRLHDLRHTHVSWLIALGIPLPTIQARLGHEDIRTTIGTYGHLLPDAARQAALAASVAFTRPQQIGSANA